MQILLNILYTVIDFVLGLLAPYLVLPGFVLDFLPGFIHYCLIVDMYFPIGLAISLILTCVTFQFVCMNISVIIEII